MPLLALPVFVWGLAGVVSVCLCGVCLFCGQPVDRTGHTERETGQNETRRSGAHAHTGESETPRYPLCPRKTGRIIALTFTFGENFWVFLGVFHVKHWERETYRDYRVFYIKYRD